MNNDQILSGIIYAIKNEPDTGKCIDILKSIQLPNKLHAFKYNPETNDSGYITMSIHLTREGAEDAMNSHKEQEYQKWLQYDNECRESNPEFFEEYPNKFGEYMDWYIDTMEINL